MLLLQISFIFLYFFNYFAFCLTSADLIPPFIQNENGLIGLWELSGAAQILNENEIMLVPPLQYSKGAAWTSVELPKIDFQVIYKVRIYEGTGGGGFGIWFVEQYDASGPLNGGPSSFKGIVLLCSLFNEGSELHFHLLQNDGNDQYYLNSLPSANFIMKIESNENISLTVQIKNGHIHVYLPDLETEIINEEMLISIDNCYMGITAQSDILTSKFDVDKIELQFGQIMNERKIHHITSNKKKIIHYQPDLIHTLRNPHFSSTILEIEKMKEGINPKEQASISHLLSIIDESNSASYEVASFKELNEFVLKTLIPITQKWHKRTVKIVEESCSLRNTFNLAWNHTQNIMKTFNVTVKKNVMKTNLKIIDLEDVLINDSNNSYIKDEFENDIEHSPLVMILFVISVIEIFAVFLLFVYMNNPKLHHKVKPSDQ